MSNLSYKYGAQLLVSNENNIFFVIICKSNKMSMERHILMLSRYVPQMDALQVPRTAKKIIAIVHILAFVKNIVVGKRADFLTCQKSA